MFLYSKVIASDVVLGGMKITGNGTFMAHRITKFIANDSDSLFSKVSLKFTKELGNNDKVVVGLKAGKGFGIEKSITRYDRITYAKLSNPDDTVVNDNIMLKLTDLYYKKDFKKIELAFGRLDFGDFFGSNKYTGDKGKQFLTNSLSSDVLVPSTSQNTAVYLKYKLSDKFSVSSAYFLTSYDGNFRDSLSILQLGYDNKKTNCNLYSWYGNGKNGRDIEKNIRGIGITASQKINKNIAVFGRYGVKNINSDSDTKYAWSSGIQLNNLVKSRKNDSIGFSVGQIFFEDRFNCKTETTREIYYRIALNKRIALSPGIQFVKNPFVSGTNKETNERLSFNTKKSAIAYYLRLQFTF
jgi:hypothetical protein